MKLPSPLPCLLLLIFTVACFSGCDNKKMIPWDFILKAQEYAISQFGNVRYQLDRNSDSLMISFDISIDSFLVKSWSTEEDVRAYEHVLKIMYLDNAMYVRDSILGPHAPLFNFIRFVVRERDRDNNCRSYRIWLDYSIAHLPTTISIDQLTTAIKDKLRFIKNDSAIAALNNNPNRAFIAINDCR